MDSKSSDCERKKDRQGSEFDILRKDEIFWQKAVKFLSKNQISEAKIDFEEAEIDNKTVAKHTEKVFNIYCKCKRCLTSRETVVGTFIENISYNQLWSKLQEIIRSYYTFLLPAEQDSIINRKYQELLTESCSIRWFSDGSIDVKKNIHVSMGSYFSISNEMTFMIVFNMLYARDRHQLFELLCLQLTSIILAYREGIKEITRCIDDDGEEYYKPEEFLNYILNGYDRITEISETQTPLVIEMREHLQKFSLTWQLMNQCMYYRFLYVDIESRMADCILRLKDAVDAETYKSFVYRFIKFDEEMTAIGQVWEVALVALELYRKSTPEQMNRVERINMIREIHRSLKDLKEVEDNCGKALSDQVLALDWIVSSVKDEVWLSVINSIRSDSFKDNRKDCKCWACLISDGNSVPDICAIPEDARPEYKKKVNEDSYHLAWCVFKHLEDRHPYSKQFFHPEVFCVFNDPPCERIECQVATNLIIGSYPLSFTKFLLRTYAPLSHNDREKFLKVPSQSLIRKFCRKKGGAAAKEILHEADEINHTFLLLNMFWDDDEIADPILRAGLAAALAENFKIDVKFPQKHIIFSYFYALFRLDPSVGDIVLDLEWLEQINLANLFKSFSNTLHESHALSCSPSSIEPIEMHLNELKITAEVSAGSNALDLVQFSMKEVADKLSSISLSDDNESAKAVIENEIKKPLVEALKLAASNKKLEAELKSLQKEHNMLKDMVKGLEQIHGEKKEVQVTVTTTTTTKPVSTESQTSSGGNNNKCSHGHNHSHLGHNHTHNHSQSGSSSPSISEDHGKDDCVCYYCTLFGKNQDLAANPRSTEARDRLRKKLHHLQSQKDFSSKSKNLKNISLLLKNGGSPSSPKLNSSSSSATSSITVGSHINRISSETTTTTTITSSTANVHAKTNGTQPLSGSMKMKVELELQHRKKKPALLKPNNAKPEDVKIQRATEINLKSLENLIEYIEGPSSKAVAEQKRAEEAAAKKQLKKVKQQHLKVRRQIEQQLDVMKETNNNLHEVSIDIKQVINQISQLKASKGKVKETRRVKAAEEKLDELYARRKRIENQVKTISDGIKTLNPDINIIDECIEMKAVMNLIAPDYVPPPLPTPHPTTTISSSSSVRRTNTANNSMAKPIPVRATLPSPSSQNQQQQEQQQKAQQLPSLVQMHTKPVVEEDPAKRMVTIRRVNLPHAEPQVTVTAKGTTPDMDQLLYTFVNGQLVPASSLHPTTFQNASGSIQLFMSSNNGQTKTVVDQRTLSQLSQAQQQQVIRQVNKNNKEKAEADALAQQQQQKQQSQNRPVDNKQQLALPLQQIEKVKDNSSAKKELKKSSDVKKKEPTASKKDLKDANKKRPENVKTQSPQKSCEAQPIVTKKKTKKAYIDPEFAANPFKLLDEENDDEEVITSETDEDDMPDLEKLRISEEVDAFEAETNKIIENIKSIKKELVEQQQINNKQNLKNEKNSQKKPTQIGIKSQKTRIIERQDSVTSAASSSSNPKDLKQSKKQKNKSNNDSSKSVVQSFPLHPQYQPTVYKPADYVKKPTTIQSQPTHQSTNSIMDQLNRGVRVEGLRLPPGITLTKVTPTNETINVKRDSINRIAQPMQDYSQQPRMDEQHMMFAQGRDPNGIIMVESNPHATQKQQQQQQQPTENSNSKKNKKKKKSKGDGNDAVNASNKLNQQSNGRDRMVTLKNPMFFNSGVAGGNISSNNNANNNNNVANNNHNNSNNSETMISMMRNLQTPPFVSPMIDPQQASIIKNENGMYTIRNPAFQNSFGSAAPTTVTAPPPISSSAAASSSSYGNGIGNSAAYVTHSAVDSVNRPYMPTNSSFSFDSEQQPKCNSVIGSEMRNVLTQRRKEQEFSLDSPFPYAGGIRSSTTSQYSHFGGGGVNFAPPNANANCDENFLPRATNYQPNYPAQIINYEDLRLQPGKMLNSEVTIHNVTESKFFQNQAKTQLAPIGTPRNLITSDAAAPKLYGDLLIQPVSTLSSRPNAPHTSEFNGSESGIYLNHGRNSVDIENDERDIEMFKQFDMNYVPPKQKMKCNINMNEIVVNSKKSTVTMMMADEFDRKQTTTSSTNSNSPSSLASSSIDEFYEKNPSYYATHHNLTDEKVSSAASSLFSQPSSNGI